jgi:thiamine biosynthesis protein ThiS
MSVLTLERPQLCLITDPTVSNLPEIVEEAVASGVTMLQVRGHQLSADDLYALATHLHPYCQQYGAAFIVNDRLDVGLAVEADGFQLGKRSLPLRTARQVVGTRYLLGASVHSLQEAQTAITEGADFLLAGTIFASSSHPNEPTSGPDLLREIKQMYPTCFLLAIGGITAANAKQVMQAGADGVAVISAILRARDVQRAVKEFYSMLKETITILANGQHRVSKAGSTVADLLQELNIKPTYVVVQLDGEIVPRTDFAQVALREGSKVEIITLAGGG